jgi:hypothetical protein
VLSQRTRSGLVCEPCRVGVDVGVVSVRVKAESDIDGTIPNLRGGSALVGNPRLTDLTVDTRWT